MIYSRIIAHVVAVVVQDRIGRIENVAEMLGCIRQGLHTGSIRILESRYDRGNTRIINCFNRAETFFVFLIHRLCIVIRHRAVIDAKVLNSALEQRVSIPTGSTDAHGGI